MKKTSIKTTPKTPKSTGGNRIDRIEDFFKKHHLIVIVASCALALLWSLLLFNPNVSIGGDDSAYINNAYNFLHGISFPTWQGPLYPILLSIFIWIFGVNIIALKFVSVVCWVASIYFTYKLLAQLTNHTTASIATVIVSNALLLNIYASTTYTEPFFMLLQVLFLNYLVRYVQHPAEHTWAQKHDALKHVGSTLLLALLSYMMFQTRSVAIVTIPFALLVLLIERRYKGSAIYLGGVSLLHVINILYRKFGWGAESVSFGGQLNGAFLKNFYKPQEGYEDFKGLVQRFWDNSELYLSKHLAKMTGFLPFDVSEVSTSLTVFFYILLIAGVVLLWKHHRKTTYIALYVAAMAGASFILLQKNWDQERLIMIYYPLVLGFVMFALYATMQKRSGLRWIYFIVAGVLLISTVRQTTLYYSKNYSIKHRFDSGTFDSYTPDWQNYMAASKWAGDNLPDTAVVVCRKQSMSWIASKGKPIFRGINRLISTDPDTLMQMFKSMGATHVIMGNLRMIPKKKTDRTINTVRNSLHYLTNKYNTALKPIKTFGTDEQAYIFEFNYSPQVDNETYMTNIDAMLIVNPKNLNVCRFKAEYYFNKQEYENGLWYVNFALSQYPQDATLHLMQGVGYFQMQSWEKSLASFEKSIAIDAANADSWYNKAVTLFQLDRLSEARDAISESKRLGKKDTDGFERMIKSKLNQ